MVITILRRSAFECKKLPFPLPASSSSSSSFGSSQSRTEKGSRNDGEYSSIANTEKPNTSHPYKSSEVPLFSRREMIKRKGDKHEDVLRVSIYGYKCVFVFSRVPLLAIWPSDVSPVGISRCRCRRLMITLMVMVALMARMVMMMMLKAVIVAVFVVVMTMVCWQSVDIVCVTQGGPTFVYFYLYSVFPFVSTGIHRINISINGHRLSLTLALADIACH